MFTNYRFYTNGRKVVAVSTYAGKTVRGVAKCSPEDTFDLEKGKRLAAARCAVKIAEKRAARASSKLDEADMAIATAERFADKMDRYLSDSLIALSAATDAVRELENSL